MSKLSANIKRRREQLNLTQEELAKKLGYKSRSTINKIELGINDLNQAKIIEFAQALDTSPSYLMGWESENYDENLGRLINYIRRSQKKSIENLAELTNYQISEQRIKEIEEGYTASPNELHLIGKYLNLDISKVLQETEFNTDFSDMLISFLANYDNFMEFEPSPESSDYSYYENQIKNNKLTNQKEFTNVTDAVNYIKYIEQTKGKMFANRGFNMETMTGKEMIEAANGIKSLLEISDEDEEK